jgi:hypothetical protein
MQNLQIICVLSSAKVHKGLHQRICNGKIVYHRTNSRFKDQHKWFVTRCILVIIWLRGHFPNDAQSSVENCMRSPGGAWREGHFILSLSIERPRLLQAEIWQTIRPNWGRKIYWHWCIHIPSMRNIDRLGECIHHGINLRRVFFIPLFSEPSDNNIFFSLFFTFFLTSALKKKSPFSFSLFLFRPPLHHLPCKYGAQRQAKHEIINVFTKCRSASEEKNLIPEINFYFYFVLRSKYFSWSILLSEQIFYFYFFSALWRSFKILVC